MHFELLAGLHEPDNLFNWNAETIPDEEVAKDVAIRFPTECESLRSKSGKGAGEALMAGVSAFAEIESAEISRTVSLLELFQ